MKRIFTALLFTVLISVGLAEQRVEMFTYAAMEMPYGGLAKRVETPLAIVTLLNRGWRIVSVSSGGGASTNSYPYLVIFVLERANPILDIPVVVTKP